MPLVRRALVLGLLIAVGSFAIDMYIPGFAAIAADLHTGAGQVQFSMTSYFLALAVGQLVYGPVSDAVGRKPPVYFGLASFAIGAACSALAPSIGMLIAARFIQGLGGAVTSVVPMASIRDEHTGPDAARLIALTMLALSVSPILAPALGGLMVQFGSWRLIFAIMVVAAGLAGIMTSRLLPETRPPHARTALGPVRILATYLRLLRSRQFVLPIAIAAFGQSVLFLFITGSPFVFVSLHHLQPSVYGGLFALHAVVLIGASQLNSVLMRRLGALRLIGASCLVLCVAALVLAGLVLGGMTALWPLVLLTLTLFATLGLMLAPAFLTALEPFGADAGAAAALGAASQLSLSSTITFLLGLAADGTARPLVLFIAAASCASLGLWLALRARGFAP